MSVAKLPKIKSGRPKKLTVLAIAQPMKRPGIAAGVNAGNMVSASATRICRWPNDKGASHIVKPAYNAAIKDAWVINRAFLICPNHPFKLFNHPP
jgi:hypothetical protein